jgi:hypothetical protein
MSAHCTRCRGVRTYCRAVCWWGLQRCPQGAGCEAGGCVLQLCVVVLPVPIGGLWIPNWHPGSRDQVTQRQCTCRALQVSRACDAGTQGPSRPPSSHQYPPQSSAASVISDSKLQGTCSFNSQLLQSEMMWRALLQVSVLDSELLKAGLRAALQVAGSVVTANPAGLIEVGSVVVAQMVVYVWLSCYTVALLKYSIAVWCCAGLLYCRAVRQLQCCSSVQLYCWCAVWCERAAQCCRTVRRGAPEQLAAHHQHMLRQPGSYTQQRENATPGKRWQVFGTAGVLLAAAHDMPLHNSNGVLLVCCWQLTSSEAAGAMMAGT